MLKKIHLLALETYKLSFEKSIKIAKKSIATRRTYSLKKLIVTKPYSFKTYYQSEPIMPSPVVFTPDMEQISPDEQQTINAINKAMDYILKTTYKDYGFPVRSVHAKSHAILTGTFTVHDHLPPHLAQGIFQTPQQYCAIMRFSTNPGDILDDKVSTPRGCAIKIFDVEGERLPDSQGQVQDFIMVNGPVFKSPTLRHFLRGLIPTAATTDKAEGLKIALSTVLQTVEEGLEKVGVQSVALAGLGGQPPTSVIGENFFSQVPTLYGPYIAKYRLIPVSSALLAKKNQKVDLEGKPNGLRDDNIDFFQTHGGMWHFQVQLCVDIEKMPVEDPTVEWDESLSPFVTVATLQVQPQVAWDEARSQRVDDHMSFSPWHGIAAHRPVGAIMRARKSAYANSADFRSTHNAEPIQQPRCPFHFDD